MSKILIVGGACQGKRRYAAGRYGLRESEFADGSALPPEEVVLYPAICRLHELARALLRRGDDPVRFVTGRLGESWLILCDEVGCGVVPVDGFERNWREAVGRLCCELAGQADIVERVSCGIPLRLKGEDAE